MDHTAALAKRFQEDGFVIVESFLEADELSEVDQQIQRYIKDVAPRVKKEEAVYEEGTKQIKHLSGLHLYDDYWKAFLVRPRTIELLEACLGSEIEVVHSELFRKPARVGTAAPPHQDNAYMHYKPPSCAAVWIALDGTTVENGAIYYVRGSHKLGDLPHTKGASPPFSKALAELPDADDYPEVPAVMKAGDAVIHHGLCVHRSGPNLSDRDRRGLVLDYKGAEAVVDDVAHAAHLAFVQQLHDQVER